jgi:hypothetical protein
MGRSFVLPGGCIGAVQRFGSTGGQAGRTGKPETGRSGSGQEWPENGPGRPQERRTASGQGASSGGSERPVKVARQTGRQCRMEQ